MLWALQEVGCWIIFETSCGFFGLLDTRITSCCGLLAVGTIAVLPEILEYIGETDQKGGASGLGGGFVMTVFLSVFWTALVVAVPKVQIKGSRSCGRVSVVIVP